MRHSDAIIIRTATTEDSVLLHRLAQLDTARDLATPALVAEVDGAPRAALSLADGRLVADPFARTADVVALLRVHAQRRRAQRQGDTSLHARLAALLQRRRPALGA